MTVASHRYSCQLYEHRAERQDISSPPPVDDVHHGATGDVDWLIVHKASFIVRLVLVPNIISATTTMMKNAILQEEKIPLRQRRVVDVAWRCPVVKG